MGDLGGVGVFGCVVWVLFWSVEWWLNGVWLVGLFGFVRGVAWLARLGCFGWFSGVWCVLDWGLVCVVFGVWG